MLSIYKASAGSGKTFRLAREYIKMILGVKNHETGEYALNRTLTDRHRHILAVTFTNKATDEMKRRIVHELAVLAGLEYGWTARSGYADTLIKELHCSEDELTEAAGRALRQLLFDFNYFQVSTIDSFFQQILRTFAREVDIAGNYDVDLDNAHAIGQGVKDMFDSLSADSHSAHTRHIVEWITRYLLDMLAQGSKVQLFNRNSDMYTRTLKFIRSISNDEFTMHYDTMMEYLSEPARLNGFAHGIYSLEQTYRRNMKEACCRALDLINARGYAGDGGSLYVKKDLMKLLRAGAAGGNIPSGRIVGNVVEDVTCAYVAALKKKLSASPDTDLDDVIAVACVSMQSAGAATAMLKRVRDSLFVLGLLERVYHYVDRYRSENNTILLSDTNALLREIIADDDAPFVYERVGVWIEHYLIDEFQDTSRMQWDNLRPLLNEGLSTDHDSLIIGDEKQCIYRFRYSDPTLLQSEVQQEVSGDSRVEGTSPGENTNWRSSARVVDFNNKLFRRLSSLNGFDDIYANVGQQLPANIDPDRGFVSVNVLSKAPAAQTRGCSLDMMYTHIRRELSMGYKPSDIAVLVRFNSEATQVIEYLMHRMASDDGMKGVRIMSDDALCMDSAPAVRLIISVMRFLAMPLESPSGQSARKKRMREISRLINRYEHLLSKRMHSEEALKEAIEADVCDISADESVGSMACFNLPSLVERIIRRYISPSVASEQSMYIAAFVDLITDFCSQGASDLHSFLRWWNETGHRSKVASPFDDNALRVMSVHKSKGLEFKCVHLPMVNWKMVEFKGSEWFRLDGFAGLDPDVVPPMIPLEPGSYMSGTVFEEQYERRCREQKLDEMNILYVAMTRAIDELVVIMTEPVADNAGASPVNNLLGRAVPEMEADDVSDAMVGGSAAGLDTDAEQTMRVTTYSFGVPSSPRASAKKTAKALDPLEVTEMQPYYTSDRDDLWKTLDIERYLDYGVARERGTVLHDVLAHVSTADSLSRAVKRSVYRRILPERESEAVERYLASQLERDEVRPWFDGYRRVLCERSIYLCDGDEGSVCRPDRVVWTAQGTVDVIDYKFGSEHPHRYAAQVRGYMKALAAMGHENVRGFVYYVDSGDIVRVDF